MASSSNDMCIIVPLATQILQEKQGCAHIFSLTSGVDIFLRLFDERSNGQRRQWLPFRQQR